MGFQSSINQALAAGATVKAAKDLTEDKRLNDKYALTGKLGSDVIGGINIPSNISVAAKEKAFKHLQDRLSTMADEARLTDMRERKARVLGIFPTKKSKEIRSEGLQRKASNIQEVRRGLQEDIEAETKEAK